jgi:Flp pilus assembly protein TadG
MAVRVVGSARTARGGAAALEMVIIVPFLAFMFAVVVDYCRIYNTAQVVRNAARAGALYASSTVTASGLTPQQAAVQAAQAEAISLNPPLQAANVTVTTNPTNVTVTVTYQFQTICPRLLGLQPQVPVSASITMPLSP